MNTVRAKLYCGSVTDNTDNATANPQKYGESITFSAMYSDSPEDNTFSAATPSASVSMYVSNPACFGFFKPGENYYFDISPCKS